MHDSERNYHVASSPGLRNILYEYECKALLHINTRTKVPLLIARNHSRIFTSDLIQEFMKVLRIFSVFFRSMIRDSQQMKWYPERKYIPCCKRK